MEKLITIQKREKLNEVYAVDEKGNGGANHEYVISYEVFPVGKPKEIHEVVTIQLQNGARKEENSIHGVIDSDLLEIVRHRLQCFQAGQFASRENACALTHIEEALMWMNRRVEDRIERNVLGTNNK
ncbi:MAG: ABC transporter ATPase [Clostridium sp.]|uniref:ABC transporter ATPase n=1 Tax=Clostridium tertium TaxID=1559 RepID=A0A9X3XR90_9CLOT|nr:MULTISPECIES: ABC transporter ATPase [Clostridium]MDC4242684.1 ABC transporter ATPase [Clostridium tertium]MDU7086193.1 ABC transporter ATPase [Clostridium sp.]